MLDVQHAGRCPADCVLCELSHTQPAEVCRCIRQRSESCCSWQLSAQGRGQHQVVWVEVAVHAHVGAAWGQVADDAPWAGPEVGKGVLCIDAALYCVPLRQQLGVS